MSSLEKRIEQWRTGLAQSQTIGGASIDELENHLREEITNLQTSGLSESEAFLVAQHRLGDTDTLATEFRKVNADWQSLERMSWMALGAFAYLMAGYVVGSIWNGGILAGAHLGARGYALGALGVAVKVILIGAALWLFWVIGQQWLRSASGKRWLALSRLRMTLLCTILVVADLILISSQLFFRVAAMRSLDIADFGRLTLVNAYAESIWTLVAPILAAVLAIVLRGRALRRRETDTVCP